MSLALTDQQRAIVAHTWDPALVFAVAGSGKTTSMVHRIARLVSNRTVPAHKILATSFSSATVEELRIQLNDLGVPPMVQCRTLHALGYQMIRSAARQGVLARAWLEAKPSESLGQQLLNQTLVQLAITENADARELGIDREDLRNQIAIWKGNLTYPDVEAVELPPKAKAHCRQAVHANGLYVKAYRIYETLRQERVILTFDDMLLMAWELLSLSPDLLAQEQARYEMVLVDEFQDVNYAQYRLMDLLTRPHRNYMAIGDDDQCIYEWRGANPDFILNFEEAYGAAVYTITDNFRCRAQQVLPANALIHRNRRRHPKALSLTRGFEGEIGLHGHKDDAAMARAIIDDIEARRAEDAAPDLVILIRLYSQTAFLEAECIRRDLPYRIEGSRPFYQRDELVTLFQYLSFAEFEAAVRREGFPTDAARVQKYVTTFEAIVNRPRRYLSRDFTTFCRQEALRRRTSLTHVMLRNREQVAERSRRHLDGFLDLIEQLIRRLHKPAWKTLRWLTGQIEYADYLLSVSGVREIGLTRVQTVEALIAFAKPLGRCPEFLEAIRDLSRRPRPADGDAIPIMTLYKAKGLEWDTVYLPGCNDGLMPCAMADGDGDKAELVRDMEAERRLFYVGMTRARRELHLHTVSERPPSPFLAEAGLPEIAPAIERMHALLANRKTLVREKDLIWLVEMLADHGLERYLRRWAADVRPFVDAFDPELADLEREAAAAADVRADHEARREIREARREEARRALRERERAFREAPVVVRRLSSSFHPVSLGDELHFEVLEDGDVMALSGNGLVGILHTDRMNGLPWTAVRWERSTVRVAGITDSGNWYDTRLERLSLDVEAMATEGNGEAARAPGERVMRLGRPEFGAALRALREAVSG